MDFRFSILDFRLTIARNARAQSKIQNPQSKIFALFLFVFICGSFLCAAEDEPYKIEVSGWSYSRERKTLTSSNRVTMNFSLKNTTKTTLNDVSATVMFTTGTGEKAAKPVARKIGALRPGEAQKFTASGDFVPAFSAYDIVVQYGGGKEEWFSSSDTGQPQPKSKTPQEGVASLVILGREVTPDRAGRFAGTVRVKNEGAAEARNLKLTITFFDTRKQKIHEWLGKLGSDALAGGAEANIQFACPSAPRNFAAYELKAGCDELPSEQALSGGEFSNVADVEVARFVFSRAGDKGQDLKVSAQVRNGLITAAREIKLTLTFYGPKKKELKKHLLEIPGQMEAGEVKTLEFTIAAVPPYEAFEPALNYKTADAQPAETKGIQMPKFRNLKEVEVVLTAAVNNDDKSLSLVGALRNGTRTPVKDVIIAVEFTKADGAVLATAEKTISDVVQPGEERNFVVKAPGAAGAANYSFRFKYSEAGK